MLTPSRNITIGYKIDVSNEQDLLWQKVQVRSKGQKLVAATIQIYHRIRAELLPTPAKSHYTFNMRDVSKVFQGIQMVGVPVEGVNPMIRLWTHEMLRVFGDRLINDEDR